MLKSLLVSISLIAVVFQAQATERLQCGPHKDVVAQLAVKYSEQPVAIGVSENGQLIEILAHRDGSTWTVIATTPQGLSCIVIAGEAWQGRLQRATDPEA